MANQSPDRANLVKDLTKFAQTGYRIGDAENSLAPLEVLTDLRLVGGPGRPQGVLAWRERQEEIRSILRSIAEDEVRSVVGDEYVEVTIRLFRLDKPKPMDRLAHVPLNDLQDELGEVFGVRRRVFVDKHRLPILEAIADALIQRERTIGAAGVPDDLEEPTGAEEISSNASAKVEAVPVPPEPDEDDSEGEEATDSMPDAPVPSEVADTEQPSTDEAPPEIVEEPASVPPRASAPLPHRLSGTARALILVVSLIAVAAIAVLVIRDQSSESGQPKSETTEQAKSSSPPVVAAPNKDSSDTPRAAPIDFTAEVVHWCYCGEADTLESQIKIKPHFVNHSARRVDLRTGGSARLGLAIYARSSSDRSWITPTQPRYRRYGKWLVVPPNAPEDLVSTTMFETHWEQASLKPFGQYLDPDHYEGDLVFNVPSDMTLTVSNVRLAYRLGNGSLYFPRKGAAGQWRGHEEGRYF